MARKGRWRAFATGNAIGGSFDAAKGELRRVNVTAEFGGRSYMSYLKVPDRLAAFCDELNRRRAATDTREKEDTSIFIDCMTELHCRHLKDDIDQYLKSTAWEMVDKTDFAKELAGKWSIKPSLAKKLADILAYMAGRETTSTEEIVVRFGFTATTAKRYMRQLTEYGHLEALGGNRNMSYRVRHQK